MTDRPSRRPDRPKGIGAIETGHRVLLAIQRGPAPVSLKVIAERAGVSASQAHRYLASLIRVDMVRAAGRGRYRLGPGLASLGLAAARDQDTHALLVEEAAALRERTGLGVGAAIWSPGVGPVFILSHSGAPERWGPFDLRTGPACSLTDSSMGNVFLTHHPVEETRRLVEQELAARHEAADLDEVAQEIAGPVVANGFACRRATSMAGYVAISAPVFDDNGSIRYAVALTGPGEHVDPDPSGPHVRDLLSSTRRLSRLFGAPPERWRP